MKTIITGATGLLGSNLAIELLRQGHEVNAVCRSASKKDHLDNFNINWFEASLEDTDTLACIFEGADVVFHCAAMLSVRKIMNDEITRINVTGTENIIRAVKMAGVPRLVHVSSIIVCGISEDGEPVDELHECNLDKFGFNDSYTTTKRMSHEKVLDAVGKGLDAVIVCPGYMIGPYDSKPSSGQLLIDIVKKRLPLIPTGGNSFVDVSDVTRGMISAWEKGISGENYILTGYNLSYEQFINQAAQIACVKPPKRKLSYSTAKKFGRFGDFLELLSGKELPFNSARTRYAYCDALKYSSKKAEQELDYKIGSMESAIRGALKWFKYRGLIN